MRSMKKLVAGALGWAGRTLILALFITAAFLGAPPNARAGLIFYDITTTMQGGSLDGQTIHTFFSYDTSGNPSSQLSPAGIASPASAAFTDNQAEITVAPTGGGGSNLQVEAYLPPGFTLVTQGSFSMPISFNTQLPLASLVGLGSVMLVDGVASTGFFTAASIVQRPPAVPEPSALFLLLFGGLVGLGFHHCRQRRERPPVETV